MIQPIRIREQAFDVVELVTAEVNAIQLTTLSPHAPNCCSSNTLHVNPCNHQSRTNAVRPFYFEV